MSGLVGGAGSKSGIIGETELDYETGTHTVVHAQADGTFFNMNSSYQTLHYTKIGKQVHITGHLIINDVSSGGSGDPAYTYMTLPFVCATGNEYVCSTGILTYEVDFSGVAPVLAILSGNGYMRGMASRDNTSWVDNAARGGDEYLVSLTYYTN